MSERIPAVILLLALPLCAQEADRKPSPFPDKNRQRESAASARAKGSRDAPNRQTRTRAGAAPVAGDAATKAAAGATTGKACFFSSGTAEGAEPGEFVAAHATYPFGTRVRVTNLANGKAIEVRIIDRLPDTRRIISVSEAAARRLGFYAAGTADVQVEPAQDDTAPNER